MDGKPGQGVSWASTGSYFDASANSTGCSAGCLPVHSEYEHSKLYMPPDNEPWPEPKPPYVYASNFIPDPPKPITAWRELIREWWRSL